MKNLIDHFITFPHASVEYFDNNNEGDDYHFTSDPVGMKLGFWRWMFVSAPIFLGLVLKS
jgi:hypothetical protein